MATRTCTQHEITFSLTLKEHLPPIDGKPPPYPSINRLAFLDAKQLSRIKMTDSKASFNQKAFNSIFHSKKHALGELVILKLEQVPKEGVAKVCTLTLKIGRGDKSTLDTPIAVLFGDISNSESAQIFFPGIEEGSKATSLEPKSVRLLELRDLQNSHIILDENEIKVCPGERKKSSL